MTTKIESVRRQLTQKVAGSIWKSGRGIMGNASRTFNAGLNAIGGRKAIRGYREVSKAVDKGLRKAQMPVLAAGAGLGGAAFMNRGNQEQINQLQGDHMNLMMANQQQALLNDQLMAQGQQGGGGGGGMLQPLFDFVGRMGASSPQSQAPQGFYTSAPLTTRPNVDPAIEGMSYKAGAFFKLANVQAGMPQAPQPQQPQPAQPQPSQTPQVSGTAPEFTRPDYNQLREAQKMLLHAEAQDKMMDWEQNQQKAEIKRMKSTPDGAAVVGLAEQQNPDADLTLDTVNQTAQRVQAQHQHATSMNPAMAGQTLSQFIGSSVQNPNSPQANPQAFMSNAASMRRKMAQALAKEAGWGSTAMDWLQNGLNVAGFIPGIGAIPDLVNSGVSLARSGVNYAMGDKAEATRHLVEAGVNGVAAIPFAGDAFKGAKILGKYGPAALRLGADQAANLGANVIGDKILQSAYPANVGMQPQMPVPQQQFYAQPPRPPAPQPVAPPAPAQPAPQQLAAAPKPAPAPAPRIPSSPVKDGISSPYRMALAEFQPGSFLDQLVKKS